MKLNINHFLRFLRFLPLVFIRGHIDFVLFAVLLVFLIVASTLFLLSVVQPYRNISEPEVQFPTLSEEGLSNALEIIAGRDRAFREPAPSSPHRDPFRVQ